MASQGATTGAATDNATGTSGNMAMSAIGTTGRRRPVADQEPGRPTRSTAGPITTPNKPGTVNSPISNQVGCNTLKSMPSTCRSIDPTTTEKFAPVVSRRNHHGPSSPGRAHWYAAAPMVPIVAPSGNRL